jgi:hypothetical protein
MRVAGLLVALSLVGALAGCRSYTLTPDDCARYREKLEGWARAKGKQSQQASIDFAKSCPGTTISRGTHDCLEKAGDEAAFFRCLE